MQYAHRHFLPPVGADEVYYHCVLKSGDMSSARLGAFAQRIAGTIVQREVAIAHEGDDFRNMRVLVLIVYASRFWLLTNASPFLFLFISSCLGLKPRSPYTSLSASSTRKIRHVLCSSTSRGCVSAPLFIHLFYYILPSAPRLRRTLRPTTAASFMNMGGVRTPVLIPNLKGSHTHP